MHSFHKPCKTVTTVSALLLIVACSNDGNDGKFTGKTVGGGDTTAPVFDGVSDTTRASGATNIIVDWASATDTTTADIDIEYEIYLSTTSGNQGVLAGTVTGGETTTTIRNLDIGTTYFVSVSAVDEDGNSNDNSAVKEVSTGSIVRYSLDIQPILDVNCTDAGCHSSTAPRAGLDLTAGTSGSSRNNIVGVDMSGCSGKYVTTSGVLGESIMLTRLDWDTNLPCGGGDLMPRGGAVAPTQLLTVMTSWIENNAPDN